MNSEDNDEEITNTLLINHPSIFEDWKSLCLWKTFFTNQTWNIAMSTKTILEENIPWSNFFRATV